MRTPRLHPVHLAQGHGNEMIPYHNRNDVIEEAGNHKHNDKSNDTIGGRTILDFGSKFPD